MANHRIFICVTGILLLSLLFSTRAHSEEISYTGTTICNNIQVNIVLLYNPPKSIIKSLNITLKDHSEKVESLTEEFSFSDIPVDTHGNFSEKYPPLETVKIMEKQLKMKVSRTELIKGKILSLRDIKGIIGVERKELTTAQQRALELASGQKHKENSVALGDISKFACQWHASKMK